MMNADTSMVLVLYAAGTDGVAMALVNCGQHKSEQTRAHCQEWLS